MFVSEPIHTHTTCRTALAGRPGVVLFLKATRHLPSLRAVVVRVVARVSSVGDHPHRRSFLRASLRFRHAFRSNRKPRHQSVPPDDNFPLIKSSARSDHDPVARFQPPINWTALTVRCDFTSCNILNCTLRFFVRLNCSSSYLAVLSSFMLSVLLTKLPTVISEAVLSVQHYQT